MNDWQGRSHSLWFCDAHEKGRFAWYVLAFRDWDPGDERHPRIEPFSYRRTKKRASLFE